MLVLGIDTSTPTGTVGLVEDANPIAEITLNLLVTHSERLLESIDFVLKSAGKRIEDLDLLAYTEGPGSFTGLRIGLSTIKGIAFSLNKKITGVSSLKSLAMNLEHANYQICVMIDARKDEVYSALFEYKNLRLKMIGKERAEPCEEVLKRIKRKTIFIGNGALLYRGMIKKRLPKLSIIAEEKHSMVRGVNVALLGLAHYKKGKLSSVEASLPNYLRKSQAEVNYKG